VGRIRIGVIGCGLVAQAMHLPHLRELHDRFELAALCDLSPGLLGELGARYGVARRFLDHRALLDGPLDAVLVATPDPHADVVVDALRAGKHVLAEKPLGYTLREADEVIAARRRAGTVCLVGYMKRYDPAVRQAAPRVRAMRDLQAIHVTVLHPAEAAQAAHHEVRRVLDVPEATGAALRARQDRLIREVIGEFTAAERFAFAEGLLSTLVHDVNLLRALAGEPEAVASTTAWAEARSLVSILRYPSGVHATVAVHFLPDLDRYDERLGFYGRGQRIGLAFPSPFYRNVPTELVLEGTADGAPFETRVRASMREAFKEELVHFAECIEQGRTPETPPEDARADIALLHRMFAALRPVHAERP
jgi:predicted dehydrogenase